LGGFDSQEGAGGGRRVASTDSDEVITICDHLGKLKFSPSLPYAFTEHGALMAASVLDTPLAVQVSLHVVRAFVSLREAISGQVSLVRRLDQLEAKYDRQFKVVFDAIREMMHQPLIPKRRRIGFIQND
jgi:hypothetical protein